MDWGIVVLILGVLGLIAVYIQNKTSEIDETDYRSNASKSRDEISTEVSNVNKTNLEVKELYEAEKYFRENNFSITKKFFPNGSMITRQLKSGKGFCKSTHDDKTEVFVNMKDKIVIENNIARIERKGNMNTNGYGFNNLITSSGSNLILSKEAINIPQKLNNIVTDNSTDYFLLLEIDDSGYTFAIGQGTLK